MRSAPLSPSSAFVSTSRSAIIPRHHRPAARLAETAVEKRVDVAMTDCSGYPWTGRKAVGEEVVLAMWNEFRLIVHFNAAAGGHHNNRQQYHADNATLAPRNAARRTMLDSFHVPPSNSLGYRLLFTRGLIAL